MPTCAELPLATRSVAYAARTQSQICSHEVPHSPELGTAFMRLWGALTGFRLVPPPVGEPHAFPPSTTRTQPATESSLSTWHSAGHANRAAGSAASAKKSLRFPPPRRPGFPLYHPEQTQGTGDPGHTCELPGPRLPAASDLQYDTQFNSVVAYGRHRRYRLVTPCGASLLLAGSPAGSKFSSQLEESVPGGRTERPGGSTT
jgi:hypothetical protein